MNKEEEHTLMRRYIALGGQDREFASAVRPALLDENNAPTAQERELQKIEQRFAASHIHLVIKIAKKYNNRPHPIEDLIGEGISGIYKAMGNFDPERGFRFSTHAQNFILADILQFSKQTQTGIKIPDGTLRRLSVKTLARANELADVTDLSEREIFMIAAQNVMDEEKQKPNSGIGKRSAKDIADLALTFRQCASAPTSLDAPVKGVENAALLDILTDTEAVPHDEYLAEEESQSLAQACLYQSIQTLRDEAATFSGKSKDNAYRALTIFIGRNLFDPDDKTSLATTLVQDFKIPAAYVPEAFTAQYTVPTLEEYAQAYEISRERVRQIEFKTLEEVQTKTRQNLFARMNKPVTEAQIAAYSGFD